MASTKKTTAEKKVDNTAENISDIKADNGRLSLLSLTTIVNTVVDSVFVERNGNIEFAAELYEVLLAYLEIGAFYPQTGVLENSLDLFFIDYIDNKYYRELGELKLNRLAQYIDNAVKQKVEAKMRQIENPLINSLVKFVDIASVLAKKYVDDIDNVGAADIQKFIGDFGSLVKKTNPQTVTDYVLKMNKKEETVAPKKQGGRGKKSVE